MVALLVALVLAGCGGYGDDASPDASDSSGADTDGGGDGSGETGGESTGDGGDGGAASADGGGSSGDDFPIPMPDGLVLDALADAGIPMDAQRQLYYDDGDYDRVVAFYDDWTSSNGEWSRGEAEGTVVFHRLDGEGTQQITVSPNQDAGAQVDGPVTFVVLVAG